MSMEMPEMNSRVKQIIDLQTQGNVSEFADFIGMSQQKMNRLFSIDKRTQRWPTVTSDILVSISEKFVNIDTDWLLTGKGGMYRTDNPNINKKQQFETVTKTVTITGKNEKHKKDNSFEEKTKNTEKGIKKNDNLNDTTNKEKRKIQKKVSNKELQPGYGRGIKLIPIEAMAGYGEGDIQVMDYETGDYIVPEFEELNVDYMIRVKGSSMYPKYNSGDLIACKKLFLSDLFFQWNKVYVLSTEQGALVKRIHKGSNKEHILLVSDNPKYEPFEIPISKIYSIALVVGVIRLE